MKKLLLILAAGLTLVATSCKKEQQLLPGGPATFGVKATSETYFPKLAKNGSQVITFAATTTDTGVREQLTASFKIGDATLVDLYNSQASEEMQAEMLPADAFSFLKNDVVVDRYNKDSRSASIQVTNIPDMVGEKHYVLPIQLESVTGSDNASADTQDVVFFVFYALAIDKGQGTKESPYLIYDVEDLLKVDSMCSDCDKSSKAAYEASVPTYFKLMADLDLTGVKWTPINVNDPFTHKVDFNGNHHTISNLFYEGSKYGGMFGVLAGECYDLNLTNATVRTNKDKSGLLAGYLGTGEIYAIVHGCYIQGTLEVDNNTIGGVGGCMCGGEIYECYVDAKIHQGGNNRYYAGALIGCGNKHENKIHDCITKGEVISLGDSQTTYNRNVAGIAGAFEIQESSITNCISLCKVECNAVAAGILGHANANSWAKQTNVNNKVIGCIAWNEEILANNSRVGSLIGSRNDYSMGAGCIVGWGDAENTLQDCWRKEGINFKVTCPTCPESETHFVTFDQPNAGPGVPLQKINCDYVNNWESMYHGKATTKTASAIAKEIGWDESIWDLSGDIPSLKNVY